MTAPLAFVDCETTGLDPNYHEVWEVALVLRDPVAGEIQCEWQLPVDLGRADAISLEIGRFYERRTQTVEIGGFVDDFARLTHGAHLVGAVPSFDAAFLSGLLRRNGACPGWHYHLVDVEALAVGYLSGREAAPVVQPPWKSDELTDALGITVDPATKHTALGDVRWAMAIYDAVMS